MVVVGREGDMARGAIPSPARHVTAALMMTFATGMVRPAVAQTTSPADGRAAELQHQIDSFALLVRSWAGGGRGCVEEGTAHNSLPLS